MPNALARVQCMPCQYTTELRSKGTAITFFVPTILTLLISSGLRDKLTTPSDKSKTRPFTEDPTSTTLPLTVKTEKEKKKLQRMLVGLLIP